MQLVLKRPKNKPPFIGICFKSEYEASRLNQARVRECASSPMKIVLEPKKTGINLVLCLPEQNLKHVYKDLGYDPEKLRLFLYETKGSETYNFAHLIIQENQHKVVRTSTNGDLFVIKIKEVLMETEKEWA